MPQVEIEIDGAWVQGWRISQGARNSRVRWGGVELDENEDLFPNDRVRVSQAGVPAAQFNFSRIVPVTPLRSLYRYLRSVSGGQVAHFAAVEERLGPITGLESGQFLSYIFVESVKRFTVYDNRHESFIAVGANRQTFDGDSHFARQLVGRWPKDGAELAGMQFVDYEVSPYRTTRSCFEDGVSASRSGQGGIDLLLSRDGRAVVGEIKASTETVGTTFALIQALTYAAELVTKAQQARLAEAYADHFAEPNGVEIAILLESIDGLVDRDLQLTRELVTALLGRDEITQYIAGIRLFTVDLSGDDITLQAID